MEPAGKSECVERMLSEVTVAGVTMTTLPDRRELKLACSIAWPGVLAVSRPVGVTVTTALPEASRAETPRALARRALEAEVVVEDQVTLLVTLRWVPSEYQAVAVCCSAVPVAMLLLVGSTTSCVT